MTRILTNIETELENYSGICYDSRQVKTNYIFVCIKGEKLDGHTFAKKAVEMGASLIISQKNSLSDTEKNELKKLNLALKERTPELKELLIYEVDDSRYALAKFSAIFYRHPSKELKIIGITGTNGKTTVSHLIQNIISNKFGCASLGTIGLRESPSASYVELGNTTPQSTDLQKIFREQLNKGSKYLTMEVSSHALDQSRVSEIDFKTVVVTNLSQDHLDYHMTMDQYFNAKAKIFTLPHEAVVLNSDDEYFERFLKAAQKGVSGGKKIITYGVRNQADIKATNINFCDDGLSFDLLIKEKKSTNFKLKLNGMFNVYNSLAAIAACLAEDFEIELIKTALEASPPVAGRFEVVRNDNSPMCIVDYAHSPDGLDNILRGARAITKPGARLVCLFGCGGDRDITKRPKMGKIAFDLADYLYVTSDNPRSEDPDQIIADILAGIPNLDKVKVIPDRAQAIKEAVTKSNKEDIVVIAGKGHEDYQILKDKTIHFDDKEEVKKAIDSIS